MVFVFIVKIQHCCQGGDPPHRQLYAPLLHLLPILHVVALTICAFCGFLCLAADVC